jgi:hypothetical protein
MSQAFSGMLPVRYLEAGEGLSPGIFRGINLHEALFPNTNILTGEKAGVFTRFGNDPLKGAWTATQAGSAGTASGYPLLLDSGDDDQGDGINYQMTDPGAVYTPAAGKVIAFEAKIKIPVANKAMQYFAGLAIVDTTLIGSNEVSALNYIGFQAGATQVAADDDALAFTGEKAGTPDTNGDITVMDGEWHTIGFRIDGVSTAKAFLDGVEQTALELPTAAIPIVAMTPSFVAQSNGSTTLAKMYVDWLCCVMV